MFPLSIIKHTFENFDFAMASDYENMLAEKKILEKIGLEIQNQIQEMFATMDDLNRFELEICLQMLN